MFASRITRRPVVNILFLTSSFLGGTIQFVVNKIGPLKDSNSLICFTMHFHNFLQNYHIFKIRIIVSRQHFTMSVYIYSSTFVCSNNCSKSVKSCPKLKLLDCFLLPMFTSVISGLPYLEVLASSKRAITLTPYSPVFNVSETSWSTVRNHQV